MKQFQIFLCWFFWLLLQSISAQEIQISGVFEPKEMAAANISVLGNMGQKQILGESKIVNGTFNISLPESTPKGIYKLVFGMEEKVYFYWLHDGETNYHFVFKYNQNNWQFISKTGNEHSFLSDYREKELIQLESLRPLYSFVASYPEKKSNLYKMALKELTSKIKAFEQSRLTTITSAPAYCKEVIKQTAIFLHDPTLTDEALESSYERTFWDNIPKNDTLFYKNPFFIDKLEQFFGSYLEHKAMPEAEKYAKIKKRLELTINQLTNHPQKNYYYNIMIRFFANTQYPYVIPLLDKEINSAKMLSNDDVKFYEYRKEQALLVGKKAPPIATKTIENFLNQENANKKILVVVGGNTPFSQQGLALLNENTKEEKDTKVYAVLLTDNAESVQNFKAIFPNWLHHAVANEEANELVKSYSLYYSPTVFIIDQSNVIVSVKKMFE